MRRLSWLLPSAYGRSRAPRNLCAAFAAALWLAGPVAADKITIAALGDSLIQGYGLSHGNGLVPKLQAWVNAHGGDVTIVNAGVSGDTSAGGRARIAWTLTPEVKGVIVALGGNDLLRGIDPSATRENLGDILARAREREVPVLLVGLEAPGNYGPAYKKRFDEIFPKLARQYKATLYPGFFHALGADDNSADIKDYLQPDGIHPNEKGVDKIVEDFGPVVLDFVKTLSPGS